MQDLCLLSWTNKDCSWLFSKTIFYFNNPSLIYIYLYVCKKYNTS